MAIEIQSVQRRLPRLITVTGKVFEITIVDYPMFGPDGRQCTSMLVDGQSADGPRRILVSKNQTLTDQARSLAYVVLRAELCDRGQAGPDTETLNTMSDIVGNLIEANLTL